MDQSGSGALNLSIRHNPHISPMICCGPRIAAICFSQFALRDVLETTNCRSNLENPCCAQRLPLLATNIGEKCRLALGTESFAQSCGTAMLIAWKEGEHDESEQIR